MRAESSTSKKLDHRIATAEGMAQAAYRARDKYRSGLEAAQADNKAMRRQLAAATTWAHEHGHSDLLTVIDAARDEQS